ncbi:type I restriction endonuclease subunit M [Duganella sp. CT11-25]|uniref:type I restriction endonuclease subunit M n=1 Tax=unclassified Duganella TaxID=2636909 RepID=UPI0039AF8020
MQTQDGGMARARLFDTGKTVATPGAFDAMSKHGVWPFDLLTRHTNGDWGDVSKEDRAANEEALKQGHRLLSAYQLNTALRVWVITEHDRSVTTILLPCEY